MKKLHIIILLILSFAIGQDRSVIFNTGSPDSTTGYLIDPNHSLANRISIYNDYVLEAMVFYVSVQSPEGNIKISMREDNNGIPGELVSDLSEWTVELDPLNQNNYNLIVTTDLCIYLNAGNQYWWTIEAADDQTQATWLYSNNSLYTYAQTNNNGLSWSTQTGNAGAGGIWAEQIYETEASEGDLNSDFTTNVIDIVSLVGYVLGDNSFTPEQLIIADINRDGSIDVVDIVGLVNIVLTPPQENPDFTLEDINPVSEYYGFDIGPSFFSGQVSCYYFGKQG